MALVEEPALRLIDEFDSVYSLAQAAIQNQGNISALIEQRAGDQQLDYEVVYSGDSEWKLLPAVDHPYDPARCLISGTGLTHLGSARDRQSMHLSERDHETDSMKIFRWGLEAGRPANGEIGIAPEWFYKGNGMMLRAHGDALLVPPYAEDGGEEAEIAVAYLIGPNGQPYRIGMMPGNEFSDHVFEKKNYLNLAGSKLRTFAIGPELSVNPPFESVTGMVAIERGGETLWSQPIATGEEEMCHSLRNLEHHHFKFALHRRPGDLHVHFLGAHSLSFGHGVQLKDGDLMEVSFGGFGRALRNRVRRVIEPDRVIEVLPLT